MTDSKIEWTGRSDWNPLRGCSRISEGCGSARGGGCYAEAIAARFSKPGQPFHGFAKRTPAGPRWTGKVKLIEERLLLPLRWRKPATIFVNSTSDIFHESVSDETIDRIFAVMSLAHWHTFQVLTKRADRMRAYWAERWQPAKAFTVNMRGAGSNVDVPAETRGADRWSQIDRAIDDITTDKMFGQDRFWTEDGDLIGRPAWPRGPLPNVWIGVSVEDQAAADQRIPALLATPAAKRFLSCEPLLAPVDLNEIAAPKLAEDDDSEGWTFSCLEVGDYYVRIDRDALFADKREIDSGDGPYRDHRIDWVIAGGESGDSARPCHPEWLRALRDQCAKATLHGDDAPVPFLFKQWGMWAPLLKASPAIPGAPGMIAWPDGTLGFDHIPSDRTVRGIAMFAGRKAVTGRHLDGVLHDGMPT